MTSDNMKVALGLFYFNPHWNLNVRSAHRHCTEALFPLLRTLTHNKMWRMTLAISGSGLEFIQREYARSFECLRTLVQQGQVELISSFYTPTFWPAFGGREMQESILRNKRCLENLGLEWNRILLSHELVFGAGVSMLQDHFDVAICRDDYLSYYYHLDFSHPWFYVGGMKVLVASNHILNELSTWIEVDASVVTRHHLSYSHLAHLHKSYAINDSRNFPAAHGAVGEITWQWYHCGDGNHFGTIYKPDNLEQCYFDQTWSELFQSRLRWYEHHGYKLDTVGAFAASTSAVPRKQLPPLVEGCGNPQDSGGVA